MFAASLSSFFLLNHVPIVDFGMPVSSATLHSFFNSLCRLKMTLPKEQVQGLKLFVKLCQSNPAILHDPQLDFYRDYLIR